MPLRDHFYLPLRGLCTWESFHSGWANEIMRQLNKTLPAGHVARPNVKLGVDVQAVVGTLEQSSTEPVDEGGGVATTVWTARPAHALCRRGLRPTRRLRGASPSRRQIGNGRRH